MEIKEQQIKRNVVSGSQTLLNNPFLDGSKVCSKFVDTLKHYSSSYCYKNVSFFTIKHNSKHGCEPIVQTKLWLEAGRKVWLVFNQETKEQRSFSPEPSGAGPEQTTGKQWTSTRYKSVKTVGSCRVRWLFSAGLSVRELLPHCCIVYEPCCHKNIDYIRPEAFPSDLFILWGYGGSLTNVLRALNTL